MPNMVLLVDTNVLIDYLGHREGFEEAAHKVITYCAKPDIQGTVAFHSIPNIWYALRKEPEEVRRKGLLALCKVLAVTSASHEDVVSAIKQAEFKDFEDCLQDKCAGAGHADYIVTRNVKDFKEAATKVITPEEFCKRFIDVEKKD